MKIVACVYEESGKESMIPVLRRQIRAPEEILVCGWGVEDRCTYDNTVYMGKEEDGACPMAALLRCAFERWERMESKERDVCFLFVGDCVLRKDATDYLRKTYVPGRVATFSGMNPYLIRNTYTRCLDPSECVLLSSKFMRMNEDKKDRLIQWIKDCQGSKGVALGYWCAKAYIPAVYIGATVQYCTPSSRPPHQDIEAAGDFISSMETDIVV